jgi:hypothetical protein
MTDKIVAADLRRAEALHYPTESTLACARCTSANIDLYAIHFGHMKTGRDKIISS